MKRLGLEGEWMLRRVSLGGELPMAIPGDIVSSLLAAGKIPDPYYGQNELDLQWIGREDWELERSFSLDDSTLKYARVFLEIKMIDTLAEIRVNGELVGKSENMFRPFGAEIRRFLKLGKNRLSVLIRSPERGAAAEAALLPYPIPASTYPVCSPHRNLIRKEQCMAGWDWGPCLMTGGIYDGISLLALDGPRLLSVGFSARPVASSDGETAGDFAAKVCVELESEAEAEVEVAVEVAGASASRRLSLPAGASVHTFSLRVVSPRLWWPNGEGEQALYELLIQVKGGQETRQRVGFRDLVLVSDEDELGRSMKFVVNGREIFAKGANWIPSDSLPSRRTRSRMAGLLRSAQAAHMNALRVWGGGRYESDDFYELCDELGILVWQDCMFSCALYPSAPSFLANVEAETEAQVKRLRSHPSLALWCGNNEALGAITWYEESKKSPARYLIDYDRLTEGVLGRVIRELDPGRVFWPSSPSAGPGDFSDNWHSDARGDMHFWSVWHEGKPFSEYLTVEPRFCSEFGFQSFPSYHTVASFAPEGERNPSSPSMEAHQRHPRGNSLIVETMLRYFRMPSGFRQTLYLSQVQQALAIKTAVEFWRTRRPRCMGSLYWQLNDVWPVSSWSSLEYDGSWKLLHYEATRFYDPLLLALVLKDGSIEAYAVNDGVDRLYARLGLELKGFDGSSLMSIATDAELAPQSSTRLWASPVSALPAKPAEAFLDARLVAEPFLEEPPVASVGRGAPGKLVRRSIAFLAEPKKCALVDARLSAKIACVEGSPAVSIRAKAPAFFVAPTAEGIAGRFEDSLFPLAAGEERILRFIPTEGTPSPKAAELEKALAVYDLRGSYE
jgi:beta-mannosidase